MQNFYTIANILFGIRGRMEQMAYFIIGVIVPAVVAAPALLMEDSVVKSQSTFDDLLFNAALLSAIWITISAAVKRLHDIGWHGGWSLLLVFGPVLTLVLLFKSSMEEDNEYGPAPGPRYPGDIPQGPRSNF